MVPADFTVREVRDLSVSWISVYGANLEAVRNYVQSCKSTLGLPNSDRIAELLGGEAVHLRQHTLNNGLRYVTVHLSDGTEIFDDREYEKLRSKPIDLEGYIPHIKRSATWALEDKPDLGDGFKLQGTEMSTGAVESIVEKAYVAGNCKTKVQYTLGSDFDSSGRLYFDFEANSLGIVSYFGRALNFVNYFFRVLNKQPFQIADEKTVSKHIRVKIRMQGQEDQGSSISVAYNLPDAFGAKFDQVEFRFGNNGGLEEVVGISQGSNRNPEWANNQVLAALKKGQNEWFRYDPRHPEAQILAQAVLGHYIRDARHNTRETLKALIEAAIKEMNIDVKRAIKFI